MNEARSLQAVINCAAYLRCLKALQTRGVTEVTAAELAKAAQEELQTVREDLQDIIGSDEPYQVAMLSTCIRHYLGYDDVCTAVLVGVGNMGSAILSYRGFEDYGIDIVAAFDRDNAVIGTDVAGKRIQDIAQLPTVCRQAEVLIGILAVPAHEAQGVCETMLQSGIQAIWNFAPVELRVPEGVLVQNENIADSLLTFSGRVEQTLKRRGQN